MNEIGQAREELDRLGRSLRQQLVALIKDVTVRVHLRQLTLDEPKVADPREPRCHHYATVYQGNRPKKVTAAETVSRTVFLLRAAGWTVATSQEDDDGRVWTVVIAEREGSVIRVLTGDDTPFVSFRGQTAALALSPPEPEPEPEPERTPTTVTPG